MRKKLIGLALAAGVLAGGAAVAMHVTHQAPRPAAMHYHSGQDG